MAKSCLPLKNTSSIKHNIHYATLSAGFLGKTAKGVIFANYSENRHSFGIFVTVVT